MPRLQQVEPEHTLCCHAAVPAETGTCPTDQTSGFGPRCQCASRRDRLLPPRPIRHRQPAEEEPRAWGRGHRGRSQRDPPLPTESTRATVYPERTLYVERHRVAKASMSGASSPATYATCVSEPGFTGLRETSPRSAPVRRCSSGYASAAVAVGRGERRPVCLAGPIRARRVAGGRAGRRWRAAGPQCPPSTQGIRHAEA